MKKIFKIKVDDRYKDYYVIASSYDDAAKKIVKVIEKEKEEKVQSGILDHDGSLKPEITGNGAEEKIIVRTIEFLTDEIY
jgi:hypothetical protein